MIIIKQILLLTLCSIPFVIVIELLGLFFFCFLPDWWEEHKRIKDGKLRKSDFHIVEVEDDNKSM
jgi:hypothetical protein